MKVAICHQGFATGDAIGNDMAGMYRLLSRLGMEPVIICGWNSRSDGFRISGPAEADWKSFDLIVYHHSQYWEVGEEVIREAICPIIFKYHNITPAHFFQPYFDDYHNVCARGREQTAAFIAAKPHTWLTDSYFSKKELIEVGADPDCLHVVPPFNRVGELLPLQRAANYASETIELLFVGRCSPHKGHLHLLRVVCVLMFKFSRPVKLRIVGTLDPALNGYYSDIATHISRLGLEKHVEVRSHCTDGELIDLYRRSHLYLCLSEHEGFNVPVIESQAIGLPVLGAGVTATGETAGPRQLFSRIPTCIEDDYFYAALAEKIFVDENLRTQLTFDGERNVLERFANEPIENAFVNAVYASLRAS